MRRSASRRPADERISPSDCTDQVANPPVAVSYVRVASCPQAANDNATTTMTTVTGDSGGTAMRLATVRARTWFLLREARIPPHTTGIQRSLGLPFSRCAGTPLEWTEGSVEGHQRPRSEGGSSSPQ